MRNSLHEQIRSTLSRNKEEGAKKQISLMIDQRMIHMTDAIVEQFKDLTDGKVSSRNQLIEMAIEEYIRAAGDVLLQDHYINIEELLDQKKYKEEEEENTENTSWWNTAIFPAWNDGFEKVFLGKKQWYSVRVAAWRIPSIEYIACYRSAPISGITHFAKVKNIEPLPNGKYKIWFDGDPTPLEKIVRLGDSDMMAIRSVQYTSLEKLKNANDISELRLS